MAPPQRRPLPFTGVVTNEDHPSPSPSKRTGPWPGALRHRRFALVLLAAVAVLLTGCTLPRTITESQRPVETPAEVVWERELPVVGGVVTTHDVVVTYTAADDGELTLMGLSTADGSTVWEHPAGRGAVRPSLSEIEPVAFAWDDQVLVAYLDPDTPQTSTSLSRNTLMVADIGTGEEIEHTKVFSFISSPEACVDRASVCQWTTHNSGTDRTFLDVDSMELVVHQFQFEGHADHAGVRHIDNSYAYELVRFTDEGTLWTRDVADLPGGSELTDVAVSAPSDESDWLAIGLHDISDAEQEGSATDLEEPWLVLLDRQNGDVIWSGAGYARRCPHAFINAGVRCRTTGIRHAPDGEEATFTDLDLTLEGFADDGTTTWTLPLGDEPGPLTGAGPHAPGGRLIVTTSEGSLLLDPDSGDTMPVPESWTFLCGEPAEFTNTVSWDVDEPEEDTWTGGSLYSTCAADGTELDRPPSVAAVRAAGVDTGAVTVVAHPGRLVAYDVTDPDDAT